MFRHIVVLFLEQVRVIGFGFSNTVAFVIYTVFRMLGFTQFFRFPVFTL
jgi:hypothetical protein